MVLGHFKNKTYYKDNYGNTACIIKYESEAVRLIINSKKGKETVNKLYKSRAGALQAWYRYGKNHSKEGIS